MYFLSNEMDANWGGEGGGKTLPFSLLIKWRSCSPWTVLIIKYPSSYRDWLHLLMMNISMLPVGRRYLPLVLSWQFCFRRIGHRFSGKFFFLRVFPLILRMHWKLIQPQLVFPFLDYLYEAAGRIDVFSSVAFTFYRSQPSRARWVRRSSEWYHCPTGPYTTPKRERICIV